MAVVGVQGERLARIVTALVQGGYDRGAIISDYDYVYRNGKVGADRADLVAFSDRDRHDLQTSCIATKFPSGDASVAHDVAKLSYLAVPFALVPKEQIVELWSIPAPTHDVPVRILDSIAYDELAPYFHRHRNSLRSDVIIAAKNGQTQLGFFDVDPTLLAFAYDATRDLLVSNFENAVRVGAQAAGIEKVLPPFMTLALQLLAGAILADKRAFGAGRSLRAAELLAKMRELRGVSHRAEAFTALGPTIADLMLDELRRQITFRSFSNEMLGHFYEHTLVTKEIRKDFGIYYTPPTIARRMIARLPIEEIPPQERIVLDGTCGSGSLLLAASERLRELLPVGWSRERVHAYLAKHLRGVDLDPFATDVTRLSLLITDFPARDDWDVRIADFLGVPVPRPEYAPRVIVANPPFRERRSVDGQREQRAAVILNRYLDWLAPGGLIGIVLPESFLDNTSGRDARKRLLRECEILELWQLPEGTFPSSDAATTIILAKKHPTAEKHPAVDAPSAEPVRVERVFGAAVQRREFLSGGRVTSSFVFPSQRRWHDDPNGSMLASALDKPVWSRLVSARSLEDAAVLGNGIIRGRYDDHSSRGEFAREARSPDWKRWLAGARNLAPYHLRWDGLYIRYPADLEGAREEFAPSFETPGAKVILNSSRSPDSPWRLYAAVDRVGYYPSQNLHCAIPRGDVMVEELAAVLNSTFANAWVDSFIRHRWLTLETLCLMPYPAFGEGARQQVRRLVRELEVLAAGRRRGRARVALSPDQGDQYEAKVEELDALVLDAYGVDAAGREALRSLFVGHRRPGHVGVLRTTPDAERQRPAHSGRTWLVTGQVIETLPQEGAVRLWISGYNGDEPFLAPIPDTMPGWALRRDCAFQARLPWDFREQDPPPVERLLGFQPLEFAFASTDQLVDMLATQGGISKQF